MAEEQSARDAGLKEKYGVTDEQLKEFRDAFSLFDSDGDNTISTEELTTVVRTLGYNPSKEEIQKMISDVDANGNGQVEFEEFVMLMQKKLKNYYTEEIIREAFDVMDVEGEGFITLPRLKQLIQDLGLEIPPDEIEEMMEEADRDRNGTIKYDALIELISANEKLYEAYERNEDSIRSKTDSTQNTQEERVKNMAADLQRQYNSLSEGHRYDDSSGGNGDTMIPDFKSMTSQYVKSEYDRFSRQTKPEPKIIKVPGQKVPITRTRLAYLQRKNKALSLDGLNVAGISHGTTDIDSPRRSVATHRSQDQWLGSIHEPNFEYNRQFKAKATGQFKNVPSRILDEKYFAKPTGIKTVKQKKQDRQLLQHKTVVVDIKKELVRTVEIETENNKDPNRKPMRKTQSERNLSITSKDSKRTPRNYQKDVPKDSDTIAQTQVAKATKDTETTEGTKNSDRSLGYVEMRNVKTKERLYYALWRTAFMNAIKKIHNKEARGRCARKFLAMRNKEVEQSMDVVSPVLQTPTFIPPIPRNSITDQHASSYADHYRKVHNMRTPTGDSQSTTPRQRQSWLSKPKPMLVTKDTMNALAATYTGRI